jgi:hypothetical protein
MNKKDWKRVTVCMSQKEYDTLKVLAGVYRQSVSAFMRHMVRNYTEVADTLAADVLALIAKTDKPS